MRLRYTPRAADELEEILNYVGERSPQGAINVKRRIKRVTDMLLLYPQSGQKTSRAGLRRVVAQPYPYLIFYEATSQEIIVHGFRHGARRPSSMPDRE